MVKKKLIIIGCIILVVAGITVAAQQGFGGYTKHDAQDSKDHQASNSSDGKSLKDAEFSFGVTDLSRKGNIVSFTIPKDANAIDKKTDNVVVSGLYDSGKGKPTDCPMVQSTEVSKSVEDYDPISGKARVTAKFDDESMAAEAMDKGCLLINDKN